MIDLNSVAKDAMVEVIAENGSIFNKDEWYLNKYNTKYPFKNEEELKSLSNGQYVESLKDWVESVHGHAMEKLCIKLGIQYPLPVSMQAEKLGNGLGDIVSSYVYDHVYIPKRDMEVIIAMKEKEQESLQK